MSRPKRIPQNPFDIEQTLSPLNSTWGSQEKYFLVQCVGISKTVRLGSNLEIFHVKVVYAVHNIKEGNNLTILATTNFKMLYCYKMAAINVNHSSFLGKSCTVVLLNN